MGLRLLSALLLGILYGARICSSYAITTTILLDPYFFESTEAVYTPASSPASAYTPSNAVYKEASSHPSIYTTSSSTKVYYLKPSATTAATWSNTTVTQNVSSSENSLLPLPLSSNQFASLFSFLNLVTSIPDEILQAGNSSVQGFLSGISSCLANQTKAVEDAISQAVPALESAAKNVGGFITSEVGPVAMSLAGDFTSVVDPAITAAASAIENGAKAVMSLVPAVTSLAAPMESAAEAIGQDIGSFFKKRRNLLSTLRKRSELGDIVNQLSTLDACLSTTLDGNSIFQIGDCAFELAKLAFPLARIAKVKELVGVVGGAAKAVKDIGTAASVGDAVASGGKDVLDLIKEVSGVNDVVKACKFLV